jgi:hypothetical protein
LTGKLKITTFKPQGTGRSVVWYDDGVPIRRKSGGEIVSTLRIGSRFLAAAAVLLSLAGIVAPAATAEGTRVLDPQLSLIGGCLPEGAKEELDPVEDPGCPNTPPPGDHPATCGLSTQCYFDFPRAATTDAYGNIYVVNWGKADIAEGSEGYIDIFKSDGRFVSEIPKGVAPGPTAIAVDSQGTLYVWSYPGKLLRFEPCAGYDPAAGKVGYCEPPTEVTLAGPECLDPNRCANRSVFGFHGLAINPENDHLFMSRNGEVVEYGSAAEGNEEITAVTTLNTSSGAGVGIALDGARHRLYVQGGASIEIFDLAEGLPAHEPYERIGTIEPSVVPQHQFGTLGLAVDEGTGDLYVFDSENTHLWELDEDGSYVTTLEFPFESQPGTGPVQITIDNGPSSPNGQLSEEAGKGRYLYVPSHPKKNPGHLFAFFVAFVHPPEVKSAEAVNVGEDEARLQAEINPGNLSTTYSLEFKAEGAGDWTQAGTGTIEAGNLDAEVSATARGLTAGAHYRMRVVATNEKGSDEAEAEFATYPSLPSEPTPCPNGLLRTGIAALLPDCRAYELVTPPNTDGHAPKGLQNYIGGPSTRQTSPAGDTVGFRIEGGSLPGFGATGSLYGDNYLARRTASGWSTALAGLSGSETTGSSPGTNSPDQGYFFSAASGSGPAVLGGHSTSYVTYPDGHSELLGQGSLGVDPEATGWMISEGGGHIIFSTGEPPAHAVQLEPQASEKAKAIYDRTPDGVTHVVSLKPGNVPLGSTEAALYKGASFDGKGIVFEVEATHTLYLRYNDEATFEVADGVKYAGIAEGGGRVFYLENGNLEAFEISRPTPITFANAAAEVIPVTISTDGSTAYFVTESVILGSGVNPEGVKPQAGGENLYRSDEGKITFVGTVTERDVVGINEFGPGLGDGLGLWLRALEGANTGFGMVPARSTPDGGVFLFKSRSSLTGYDSDGKAEIYRFDAQANQLQCLSCNPTGTPASADATLQSDTAVGWHAPWPENLRDDGRRVFFETSEPLVARDGDGLEDVYEWEAQGVGSCSQPEGCLFLISSPQSSHDEHLFAVSRSGDDVFFLSSDLLVGSDADDTPSIYDARVGGGFAEPVQGVCEGEGCRPTLTPPPSLPTGDTSVHGTEKEKAHHCGKGKRKVKRHGRVRCVKRKHHGKRSHQRTGTGQKGGHR